MFLELRLSVILFSARAVAINIFTLPSRVKSLVSFFKVPKS
ncbi:uncharacterized protein METZ01_LOCUS326817, partial [marine metagenome]